MEKENITELDIDSYLSGIKNGDFSVSEGISEFIKNIRENDDEVGAFLDLYEEEAMERARKLEESKDGGKPLFGIPVAIKDNILIENKKTTAASKILENYIASYTATVAKRIEDAGAIIVGKTNLDEFAMGSSTENSAFKITKNPMKRDRVPGGSSGGSAASVSANMSIVSLGSDTGGSIRQPAAFCGVVGFKPTYGAVSRYGLIALASSLDQIGPFSKTVKDSAKVFSVIAGADKFDSTSEPRDYSDILDFIKDDEIKKLKIGVPKEYFIDGIQKEVDGALNDVINKFKLDGFEIKEISLPYTKYSLSVYYIIMPAEASSNLARFDGIRYSRIKEAENSKSLLDLYLNQKGYGFGDEVKRRVLLGTFVLSAGYYDAYYKKAQKVRRLIMYDFIKAFDDVDVILSPVTPTTAFKIGEKTDDPLSMYLSDIFTIPANLAGIPAISIPSGIKDKDGLPIGFQLMGRHFEEKVLFSLGDYFERRLK